MGPEIVVVSRRDRVRADLALRLGRLAEAAPAHPWTLSDLFACPPAAPRMAIVDVLELFPEPDCWSLPISPATGVSMLVVGFRADSDALLAAMDEGIPVHVLEDLTGATILQMVGMSRRVAELYLLAGRLCAERVWRYLRRRCSGSMLTRREAQILQLVADGHSNRRIARTLGIEPKTVKNHLTRIYEKLGVSNRCHAAARASTIPVPDDPPIPRTS